jgi:hypothetical protein
MFPKKGLIEAGHQPNYLPWLGFFDKMQQCDIFIIENDVQLEKQGFIVRNKIKTPEGARWLTVPIRHMGGPVSINEAKIASGGSGDWRRRHWLTIKHSYSKSPFWEEYGGFFEETYSREWEKLIDLNMHIIKGIMKFLQIEKPLVLASDLAASGNGSELIINQCKALGAKVHLSGVGGRNYLDLKRFEDEGIDVLFQEFEYPNYKQLHGVFIPNLSAIDYLFCVGNREWRGPVTLAHGEG